MDPSVGAAARAAWRPFIVTRLALAVWVVMLSADLPGLVNRWDDGCARMAMGQTVSPGSCWPLLPMLINLLAWPLTALGGGPLAVYLVSILVSQGAFFLGLLGLWRLVGRWLSPEESSRTLWLLCCFPFSYHLGFGAPVTLTFCLLVWAFEYLEAGDRWTACALAAVACLVDALGALGALCVVIRLLEVLPRRLRPLLPATLIGVALLGLACFYGVKLADPLKFLSVAPGSTVGRLLAPAVGHWWDLDLQLPWSDHAWLWAALLLAASVETRFGMGYASLLLAWSALPALAGGHSLEEPASIAFPAFMVMSAWVSPGWFRLALALCGLALLLESARFFLA